MNKLAVTVLVLALSLLTFAGAAMAERGDIGGVGVKSMSIKKLR